MSPDRDGLHLGAITDGEKNETLILSNDAEEEKKRGR